MSRTRVILSFVLSLLIGAALLAVAAWDLDLSAVRTWFAEADAGALAAALGVYALLFGVVHALRIWRWVYLIRPLDPEVPFGAVIRAGAIGFTAIILLPLRLGEFVRPYVLSRESDKVSMSAALGTVVVERVVDGLFITLLLFLTLWTYGGTASTTFATTLGSISLAIFVSASLVCVAATVKRDWTLALIERLASLVSTRLADALTSMLSTFLDGIGALSGGRHLLPFLGLTLAYWTVNGLSIALLASGGFGLGLSAWGGMTVLAILVVGIMIPTGPAMAGNYELFTLSALSLFESEATVATAGAAFVAAMHVGQFIVQVVPGLVLLWTPLGGRASGYKLLSLSQKAAEVASPTSAQSLGEHGDDGPR